MHGNHMQISDVGLARPRTILSDINIIVFIENNSGDNMRSFHSSSVCCTFIAGNQVGFVACDCVISFRIGLHGYRRRIAVLVTLCDVLQIQSYIILMLSASSIVDMAVLLMPKFY